MTHIGASIKTAISTLSPFIYYFLYYFIQIQNDKPLENQWKSY